MTANFMITEGRGGAGRVAAGLGEEGVEDDVFFSAWAYAYDAHPGAAEFLDPRDVAAGVLRQVVDGAAPW